MNVLNWGCAPSPKVESDHLAVELAESLNESEDMNYR